MKHIGSTRAVRIFLLLCILYVLLITWLWQAGSLDTAMPEGSASRQLFDTEVVTLLDRRCSNCHGVSVEEYDQLEADPASRLLLRWPVDTTGRISSPEFRKVAYERARTTRTEGGNKLVPIDVGNPALASKLLLAPLSETYAGMSMVHPVTFTSPQDSDFSLLKEWVQAEIDSQPH